MSPFSLKSKTCPSTDHLSAYYLSSWAETAQELLAEFIFEAIAILGDIFTSGWPAQNNVYEKKSQYLKQWPF